MTWTPNNKIIKEDGSIIELMNPTKERRVIMDNGVVAQDPLVEQTPTSQQVGGTHYSSMKIQPIDFIAVNKLGFMEGNVVKYVARHKTKNGAEDIRKAIQYLNFILQYEYGEK